MLTLQDTSISAITKLSAGNPGALSVLMKLMEKPDGLMDLLNLDDMGISGPSVWLGYKDFAGEDIEKFRKALHDRDPAMVQLINSRGGKAWTGGRS